MPGIASLVSALSVEDGVFPPPTQSYSSSWRPPPTLGEAFSHESENPASAAPVPHPRRRNHREGAGKNTSFYLDCHFPAAVKAWLLTHGTETTGSHDLQPIQDHAMGSWLDAATRDKRMAVLLSRYGASVGEKTNAAKGAEPVSALTAAEKQEWEMRNGYCLQMWDIFKNRRNTNELTISAGRWVAH